MRQTNNKQSHSSRGHRGGGAGGSSFVRTDSSTCKSRTREPTHSKCRVQWFGACLKLYNQPSSQSDFSLSPTPIGRPCPWHCQPNLQGFASSEHVVSVGSCNVWSLASFFPSAQRRGRVGASSFFWLSNVPSCGNAAFGLSAHPGTDVRVASTFCL